jgi:hypothetical protein
MKGWVFREYENRLLPRLSACAKASADDHARTRRSFGGGGRRNDRRVVLPYHAFMRFNWNSRKHRLFLAALIGTVIVVATLAVNHHTKYLIPSAIMAAPGLLVVALLTSGPLFYWGHPSEENIPLMLVVCAVNVAFYGGIVYGVMSFCRWVRRRK